MLEKRVENTTRSGVFLTNLEMLVNEAKQSLECLIYILIKTKTISRKKRI